jgi:hypothetical protein
MFFGFSLGIVEVLWVLGHIELAIVGALLMGANFVPSLLGTHGLAENDVLCCI